MGPRAYVGGGATGVSGGEAASGVVQPRRHRAALCPCRP